MEICETNVSNVVEVPVLHLSEVTDLAAKDKKNLVVARQVMPVSEHEYQWAALTVATNTDWFNGSQPDHVSIAMIPC